MTHDDLPLGRQVDWPERYAPELLAPIPRRGPGRDDAGRPQSFTGFDLWQAWELSWLNPAGRPEAALGRFVVPCESPAMIESKSLKLYLNSLNQHRFESIEAVRSCIATDLERCAGTPVRVQLLAPRQWQTLAPGQPRGDCLDSLEVSIDRYHPDAGLLELEGGSEQAQCYHSHLLRSLCPVTGQPDWGSLEVRWHGPRLAPTSLLRYIVSYRQHQGFHEQCVERIFSDLYALCQPRELTVSAWYLRRGGLDINPVRSTHASNSDGLPRLLRQ